MKDHIERKHAPEEVIICCNDEKSDMEFIPEDEKDDLFEDSIEVWKIYKMLQRMKKNNVFIVVYSVLSPSNG